MNKTTPFSEISVRSYIDTLSSQYKFDLYENYVLINNEGMSRREIDFFLYFKEYNFILIIEAKGDIWTNKNNQIVNKNAKIRKDPFQQAIKQVNDLKDLINDISVRINYIVWFTDCNISIPVWYENNCILPQHSTHAAVKLNDIVALRLGRKVSVDNKVYENIKSVLFKKVEYKKTYLEIQDLNSKAIDKNTNLLLNRNFISIFNLNKKVLVTGRAGTGKSAIAKFIADENIRNDKKVLYICYNLILGENLRISFESTDKCIATDLISLYNNYNINTQLDLQNLTKSEKNELFENKLPNEFTNKINSLNDLEKYDVLIIDEAQDFSVNQIESLYSLLNKDHSIYIFKDDYQYLHSNKSSFNFDDYVKVNLEINFRNPKNIFELIQNKFNFYKDIEVPNTAPLGNSARYYFENKDELINSLKMKINELINKDIKPGQIFIFVGDDISEYQYLCDLEIVENVTIKLIERSFSNCVASKYVNLIRPSIIKGMELNVVFIIDAQNWKSKNPEANIDQHLYTAISRCNYMLFEFIKKN